MEANPSIPCGVAFSSLCSPCRTLLEKPWLASLMIPGRCVCDESQRRVPTPDKRHPADVCSCRRHQQSPRPRDFLYFRFETCSTRPAAGHSPEKALWSDAGGKCYSRRVTSLLPKYDSRRLPHRRGRALTSATAFSPAQLGLDQIIRPQNRQPQTVPPGPWDLYPAGLSALPRPKPYFAVMRTPWRSVAAHCKLSIQQEFNNIMRHAPEPGCRREFRS
jgi:hypothetical protein